MARSARKETAMYSGQDIIIVLDYHAENIEYRWFDARSGEERTGKYPTSREGIGEQLD